MRNKIWVLIASLIIILILAAAAYLATGLLNQKPVPASLTSTTPNAKKPGGLHLQVKPAPGIPSTNPDLGGKLVERKDNSLWVKADSKAANADTLPPVEVVVTAETMVVEDKTKDSLPPNPDLNTVYPQIVVPFKIEQLKPGDQVIAWGEKRGDRLVASVVMIFPAQASSN